MEEQALSGMRANQSVGKLITVIRITALYIVAPSVILICRVTVILAGPSQWGKPALAVSSRLVNFQ